MATRRKRVKVETGQVVGVPLRDGTFALAHVAVFAGSITCVLFTSRAQQAQQLLEGLDDSLQARPFARMMVTSDEIEDGYWLVLAIREPRYAAEMLDTKGSSYTASMTRAFFEAYHGIQPWDEMADPRYWEKRLLPGVPIPPTIRFKRDFENEAAAAMTAAPASPTPSPAEAEAPEPPITEGPGVIHIEMTYPGEELPSVELLHQRQALERALEAAGGGEVTDAGGGGGIMDIYLETEDVARALPLVQAALKASELGESARVEVEPPLEE